MARAIHPTTGFSAQRRGISLQFDRRILMVGLMASVAFGMTEMIIEAAVGHGFWSPVRYIAAVFTRGADTDPGFAAIPVIVGLVGHMMNAAMFGMVFAAMTRSVRDPLALIAGGMAYGAAIFAVMWYGVLPAIDPAMKLVNTPGFILSHLMFGALLGAGIAAVRGRAATERVRA